MKEKGTKADYTNESQQRILNLVLVLFGDVVNGYSVTALADHMGVKPPVVTRDLSNLVIAGVAEKDHETGLWRLTTKLPQQAMKVMMSIQRARSRIDELDQRFNRTV